MSSREGFDAFVLYMGIKLHFHSKGYDFVKYNGKVKTANLNSFMKRKDKYHFAKLFRKHKHELKDFLVANLSTKDQWVGELLDDSADRTYTEWKKRNQRLSYTFETEISDLMMAFNIQELLEVQNGQHPYLLKKFMSKQISLQTICIMDEIIGFTDDWKRLINEGVVYPDIHLKIQKYKSFLDYDYKKYKQRLIELCSQ
jgi:hypothetical protein